MLLFCLVDPRLPDSGRVHGKPAVLRSTVLTSREETFKNSWVAIRLDASAGSTDQETDGRLGSCRRLCRLESKACTSYEVVLLLPSQRSPSLHLAAFFLASA